MATNQYGGSTSGLSALVGTPNANIGTKAVSKPAVNNTPAKPAAAASPAVNVPINNVLNTSGGSGSSSTYDPNAVAYYNDVVNQLTSELTAAQNEQGIGLSNINNAFDNELNQLNQGESQAESSYNTQDAQNGQQRESNINTIGQGARSTYDSLLSLLSAAGSGVSSAAKYNAPQAVSLNASNQRAGANTTFNTNATSIGTARKNTEQAYNSSVADLNTQKNSQIESFMSNLLGQEAQLQQGIGSAKLNAAEYGGKSYKAAEGAGANENAAVNSIESQLSDLFKQYATPTFNVTPVTASQPNLATYQYDPTSIKAASSNPSVDSSIATYLPKNINQGAATAGLTTGATAPVSAGA